MYFAAPPPFKCVQVECEENVHGISMLYFIFAIMSKRCFKSEHHACSGRKCISWCKNVIDLTGTTSIYIKGFAVINIPGISIKGSHVRILLCWKWQKHDQFTSQYRNCRYLWWATSVADNCSVAVGLIYAVISFALLIQNFHHARKYALYSECWNT